MKFAADIPEAPGALRAAITAATRRDEAECVAALAAGLRQYSRITVGPRTRISPVSPTASGRSPSPAMRISMPSCATPTEPSRASSSRATASATSARSIAVIVIGDSPCP